MGLSPLVSNQSQPQQVHPGDNQGVCVLSPSQIAEHNQEIALRTPARTTYLPAPHTCPQLLTRQYQIRHGLVWVPDPLRLPPSSQIPTQQTLPLTLLLQVTLFQYDGGLFSLFLYILYFHG